MSAPPEANRSYLPELDGLRALAIVSVLIYHLQPSLLPGGFLGVDVFFVLSGFLITRLIWPKISTGSFSFADFYARRVRRLMPVFAATLLLTWVAAWLLFFPKDLLSLARTTFMALLCLANYHFAGEQDYFAPDVEANPLLHLWSLAVEEQFYFLFPLLLVGLQRWQTPARPLKTWLATVALAGSFAVAWILVRQAPSYAFYALESRAWELVAGAVLAGFSLKEGFLPKFASLAWLGLGLTLGSFFSVQQTWPLPAPAALPAVLGTLTLLATRCGGEAQVLWRVLVTPPLRYLGRLSYALYLVHWPVIVFYRLSSSSWSAQDMIGAGLLSFLLAAALHHGVENPIRFRWSGSRLRSLAYTGLALWGLLLLGSKFTRSLNGYIGAPAQRWIEKAWPQMREPKPLPARWLKLGLPAQTPEVMLIGDSHAQCLVRALDAALTQEKRAGTCWVAPSTLPLVGVQTSEFSTAFEKEAFPQILASPAKTVILCATWSSYLSSNPKVRGARLRVLTPHQTNAEARKLISAALERTLQACISAGKRVVIIHPIPGAKIDVPIYLAQQMKKGQALAPELTTLADYQKRHAGTQRLLHTHHHPTQLIHIYPAELFQEEGRLRYQIGGLSLYEDNSHLTQKGAELLMAALLEAAFKIP